MAQEKILVLSDLHCGSNVGLLPPNFKTVDGTLTLQNSAQSWLWERFSHMVSDAGKGIKKIVINGDMCDGAQWKSKGDCLTLHRIEDQAKAAIEVIKFVQTRISGKLYIVYGTPYHELPAEVRGIAKSLSANECAKTLILECCGTTVRFHHEVSFSGGFLKAASLEKELVFAEVDYARNNWPLADAEIRSHTHHHRSLGLPRRIALTTPGWQLQTDFTTKRSPTDPPDIGSVVLTIDGDLKRRKRCPVSFTLLSYPYPQPEVIK